MVCLKFDIIQNFFSLLPDRVKIATGKIDNLPHNSTLRLYEIV